MLRVIVYIYIYLVSNIHKRVVKEYLYIGRHFLLYSYSNL